MTGASSSPGPGHVPVLPAEVLHYLAPAPGQTMVDATVGLGGHARLIAERIAPTGRLLGIDQDPTMLALARPVLAGLPVSLVEGRFDDLPQILDEQGLGTVDAVLADLGVCSAQLDDANRGLSFMQPGPLDMRLNPGVGESAAEILERWSERDLADLFWEFGEERFSRRIARRIVENRSRQPFETTEQLADLVRRSVPRPRGRRPTIDPATRVFQALRIAVNDELGALDRLLQALPTCIKPGGRAVVISFHSLEDRRVKQALRQSDLWEVLTRKPVVASAER